MAEKIIQDNEVYLTSEIEKSKRKSEELRNLYKELQSKITVENSWRRYLQYRLNRVRSGESDNKRSDESDNKRSDESDNKRSDESDNQ